ncbi:HAD family hydrolase [Candidatus Woesearchaeota archaeon]|nr:HAD family hydrolase [Candidatus Woesearchaeota archaeon]
MAITTFMFDLDDTLIDSTIYVKFYHPLMEKVKEKLKINDFELDEKAKELGLKKNKFNLWDSGDFCKKAGLLDLYYEELEKVIHVTPFLHDNVEGILRQIKSNGVRIGIVSNSMQRTIKSHLKIYGLLKYIDFIFSADDAGSNKKTTDIFWETLIEKEKLVPAECIMIGDDIEGDINKPKKFGFNTHHIKDSSELSSVLEIK